MTEPTVTETTDGLSLATRGQAVHVVATWVPITERPELNELDTMTRLRRFQDIVEAAAESGGTTPGSPADAPSSRSPHPRVSLPPRAAAVALERLCRGGPPPAVVDLDGGSLAQASVHTQEVTYEGRRHLHVGVALWSEPLPVATAGGDETRPRREDPALAAVQHLSDLGELWQAALNRSFQHADYTIGDIAYRPPSYWYVTPDLLWQGPRQRRELLDRFLLVRHESATVVDASVIDERFGVWRRVETQAGEVRPRYLVSPLARPSTTTEEGTQVETERVVDLVRVLHELEGRIAATLGRRQTDLELDQRLLATYQSAATAGTALWDRLAMHLTSANGELLDWAHKQILLVHQTLLQSVSDLQNITKHVAETAQRIDTAVASVERRFDEELVERLTREGTETHDNGRTRGIRDAIVRTGLSAQVRRNADQTTTLAATVSARTTSLFDAVASALDSRRAREGDVLQRFAVSIVVIAAALSFTVSILANGLADTENELHQLVSPALGAVGFPGWLQYPAVVVVPGLLAVAVAVRLMKQVDREIYKGRRLGQPAVTDDLNSARALLSACSSERLDWEEAFVVRRVAKRLPQTARSAWYLVRQEWEKIDQTVARRFAETWDRSQTSLYGEWPPAKDERSVLAVLDRGSDTDLNRLQDRVGRWAVQSLLLTERPRRFDHYHLPRLCFLLRHIRRARDAPEWMAPVGSTRTEWFGTPEAPVSRREAELVLCRYFPGTSLETARAWDGELEAAMPDTEAMRASELTACQILDTVNTWLDAKAAAWEDHLAQQAEFLTPSSSVS